MTRKRLLLFLPLLLFAAIALFMAANLGRPQQVVVESRMVGKPLPDFALAALDGTEGGLSRADLAAGKPAMVNIFASWCLPCQVEAPQLQALADRGVVLHGVAVRDTSANIGAFLARHGNPFQRIGADSDGRFMLALGASGVPETFVVDGRGIVRHQHIGEIRAEHVDALVAQYEAAK